VCGIHVKGGEVKCLQIHITKGFTDYSTFSTSLPKRFMLHKEICIICKIFYFKEENMKEIQFSIEINACNERVWATLWEDITFRDWANIIDEGTYMKGVMKEGNEIQYISSVNGYGVTSLIEKLNPNEFALFRHAADTKESGQQEREKEWTGGTESYSLTEKNGVTILIIKIDVPLELEETFNIRFPRALERLKALAEKMQ